MPQWRSPEGKRRRAAYDKAYRAAHPPTGIRLQQKRARARRWRLQHPDRTREDSRRQWLAKTLKRLGLTRAQHEEMSRAQEDVCAGCLRPERRIQLGKTTPLCIDHCHQTGAVRGLLCHGCNSALGYVQDDPATLRRLAEYLERHEMAKTG